MNTLRRRKDLVTVVGSLLFSVPALVFAADRGEWPLLAIVAGWIFFCFVVVPVGWWWGEHRNDRIRREIMENQARRTSSGRTR